jgi:hypothetical protein
MSIYYISERDNLLEELIKALRIHLHGDPDGNEGDLGFQNMYKKFGTVRVSATHPFALINSSLAARRQVPTGLFPSITVAIPSETDQDGHLNYAEEYEKVTVAMVQAWLDIDPNRRLISTEKLEELLAEVQAKTDASLDTWSTVRTFRYGQQLAFAVWSENDEVTRSLYQICRSFNNTHPLFFENLGYENATDSGSPTGLYNTEFGRVLFGAEYTLSGANQTIDRTIDTSIDTIQTIRHSVVGGDITSP